MKSVVWMGMVTQQSLTLTNLNIFTENITVVDSEKATGCSVVLRGKAENVSWVRYQIAVSRHCSGQLIERHILPGSHIVFDGDALLHVHQH